MISFKMKQQKDPKDVQRIFSARLSSEARVSAEKIIGENPDLLFKTSPEVTVTQTGLLVEAKPSVFEGKTPAKDPTGEHDEVGVDVKTILDEVVELPGEDLAEALKKDLLSRLPSRVLDIFVESENEALHL